MRNGQIFLVDAASTNGTQLNGGDDLAAHAPMLLKNGDVITMGSTELLVAISDAVDDVADENTFS
jgi:pSer/pThr/pTyr-binding forkhead associated (FHA) protein